MTADTDTKAPPPELHELENVTRLHPGAVVIRVRHEGQARTTTVVAEPSSTPGLVINPAPDAGGGFTGWWTVTHAASGFTIPSQLSLGESLPAARRIAAALGTTGVEWTLPYSQVREQITEHIDAVAAAVREGRYLAPEPDDATTEKATGPAPYPRSEAQATADAIARDVVSSAHQRCGLTWKLIKRANPGDEDGLAIYGHNVAALMAEFGLAAVLRDFAHVDQAAADAAARDVWNAWEDGGSVHEWIGEWADEYGIPQPTDDDETPPTARAAAELAAAVSAPGDDVATAGAEHDCMEHGPLPAAGAELPAGELPPSNT